MSEVQQIILPEGFKRVEYLQSTGNEVIYTGIIPTDKHGFYAEIESLGGTTGYACGTQSEGGSPGFWIYVSNGVLQASYENNTKTTVSANSKVTIKNNFLNDRKLVSDKSVVKNYSQDFTYNWSYEFTVFKSTYTANTKFDPVAPIRIYRFKISENEKIIRDFVPCLDVNDTPCMYDILGTGTIEENTYYNQGDGQFYYPRDYPSSNYNLPAGFKKCVYLQSDGTQWIDTGVVPNNETGLFCKTIKFDNSNSSMFGVRENASTAIMIPYVGGKTLSYRWKAQGKDNIYTLDKAGDYIFSSFINFYNDRLARIDSEDTDWATPLSGILENYTRNIWLFSTNFQGTFNNTYGKYVGRIYRAQITQGDALIHDYVPCLDADNRPCMYDIIGGGTVEDNTYYNQSGGTEFTYCVEHQLPSDFIKLKYLESTGTQYIETGYVPTNTTGLYIDALKVGNNDGVPMGIRNANNTDTCIAVGNLTQQDCRFHWNTYVGVGGSGKYRFESSLNWLNDKKSIIKTPIATNKINTLSNLSFTPNQDFHIFGWNLAGKNNVNWDGRIYRAKISEGDQIVRDFVPAWDERKLKPCMYDLINNVAYYNDGTGEFLHNRDYEGNYKGFTGLGCIGNRLSGNTYTLVNALITDGRCRINLGKGIIDATISHDFRGYTTNKNRFMFGTSTTGNDYFWQGHGYVALGGRQYSGFTDNSDIIVVVDIENSKIRCNKAIYGISSITNFTSDKQTSIFDVGRKDTETSYMPAANGSKFYKWVMKKDDEIIHDYRPAVDNNSIPCVLDTITGEAFYNSLSGILTWE